MFEMRSWTFYLPFTEELQMGEAKSRWLYMLDPLNTYYSPVSQVRCYHSYFTFKEKCSERLNNLAKDTQLIKQSSWMVTFCLMLKLTVFLLWYVASNLLENLLSRYIHIFIDILYHFRKPFQTHSQTQNWSQPILKTRELFKCQHKEDFRLCRHAF